MSLAVTRSATLDADWRQTYASMIATPAAPASCRIPRSYIC